MRLGAAMVFGLLCGAAWADGTVQVCYNYGCAVEEIVLFSDSALAMVREMLAPAATPEDERAALALAVARLYRWAGEQTPIWRDRGGNYDDDQEQDGRMDCIDHSTTTTRFLRMLGERGWLHFHRVLEPARRTRLLGLGQHFSAVIEELGPVRDPAHPDPERYVMDTWFRDHGLPAVVMPLENWMEERQTE